MERRERGARLQHGPRDFQRADSPAELEENPSESSWFVFLLFFRSCLFVLLLFVLAEESNCRFFFKTMKLHATICGSPSQIALSVQVERVVFMPMLRGTCEERLLCQLGSGLCQLHAAPSWA